MVESQVTYNTVIVYNRMNLAAVISAAMCANVHPEALLLDVTQLVPDDALSYIWIGIDPKANAMAFWHKVKTKEHTVIVEDAPLKPLAIQLNPFKTKFPDEAEIEHDEAPRVKTTLIKKTMDLLGETSEQYQKLDFHVARFYDRSMEVEFLAFVYGNLCKAQACIDAKTMFEIKPVTNTDIKIYLEDVKKVKTKFSNSYLHTVVMDGERVRPVVQTAFSDFTIHLALRLSKLVHRNFLNTTMGLSGAVVYTNMRHVIFDKNIAQPLVLN